LAAAGALADTRTPLVVLDLASVETYLLVQPLSWLAVEEEGAIWCPLPSGPTALDRDRAAAEGEADRLELPISWPEAQPVPVSRAMRVAALAAVRGCAARFIFAASRLAFGIGGDMDDPEQCLLAATATDLEQSDVKSAGEPASEWSGALDDIKVALMAVGITRAPTVRWYGDLYTGFGAIRRLLRETDKDG
jgi:2-hydroxychromene-2-carboxylate isomerase